MILKMENIFEDYKPDDVDVWKVAFFADRKKNSLAGAICNIFKNNGNCWSMPKDKFERAVSDMIAGPGGVAAFIGLNSPDRIKDLGILEFDDKTVQISEIYVEHQVACNLRPLPEKIRMLRQKFGL